MKRDFIYILIIVCLVLLNLHTYNSKKVYTTTDTVYVSKVKYDTLKYYFTATKVDSSKIRIINHTDTLLTADTVYLAYSSPFKLGGDTLSVEGTVSTDVMEKSFIFDAVKFRSKERIITKYSIDVQKELNWYYIGGAFIIGVVIGSL